MKKEILKRIVVGSIIGIALSYIITVFISVAIGDGNFYSCAPGFVERFDNELKAVIIQTVLSAVLGAAFSGSSVIWEIDEWSLLKQTGIYLIIVSAAMLGIAYVCEWMEHSLMGVISYCGIFLAIFVVIWISRYLFWRAKISGMKSKIEKGI